MNTSNIPSVKPNMKLESAKFQYKFVRGMSAVAHVDARVRLGLCRYKGWPEIPIRPRASSVESKYCSEVSS